MRTLVRLVAVAVTTLGLTPALQGHAWACSCVTETRSEQQIYADAARAAKLVYVARVDSVRTTGKRPSDTNHFKVTVTEALKGEPGPRRELHSAANGGLCGVHLTVREPVLVFDDGSGDVMSCGETTQTDVQRRAAIVRAALREPQMPRTGGELPAVALAVVTGAAYAARRRRAS